MRPAYRRPVAEHEGEIVNLRLSLLLLVCAVSIGGGLYPFSSFGQSKAPDGFRITGDRGGVRITKEIARQINREVASTNRMNFIQNYVEMLSSEDLTNRMFAIYALGQFESPQSLAALFAHSRIETNQHATCLLADSVCGLFPYWPGANQGFNSEKWDCQAVLKEWSRYYERHGYLGMFEIEYAKVKGNLEAEAMFIVGFATDTPSPDLLPFYQNVSRQTSFPKIRNACLQAIDNLATRK